MRYSLTPYIGRSAALVIALAPALAFAQQQAGAKAEQPASTTQATPAAQAAPKTDEANNVVIVTGVTRTTTKKNATFSINTLSAEDIQRLAPISTADLLSNLPGIYAEGSTAGEASNNITVRGLPVAGGYRFAPQLIDGLPAYEEPDVPFLNNDVFVRDDLMTESIEAVKGGPGGILYSNGLGATINHITRTGGDHLEGGYKLEYADYGFIRQDAFVSGPLSKNLTGAVGGFYRRSKGIRDTGYTADRGGQIRGNLVYTSDHGARGRPRAQRPHGVLPHPASLGAAFHPVGHSRQSDRAQPGHHRTAWDRLRARDDGVALQPPLQHDRRIRHPHHRHGRRYPSRFQDVHPQAGP
jgi:outer membrane receptor protein involved in Fe transport